jgi:outer membrane protein OmpA-like peptidoglycan-associated protein
MWSEVGAWPSMIAGTVQQKLRAVRAIRTISISQAALVAGLAMTVAACSSIDSMFGSDAPPPTARTTGGAAPAQSGTTDNKDFPRLSTVPPRPERPTPPPQQGLAADRQGARYADNEVRPVNEAADAVVGQRLGASTPRQAAPASAPQSAPQGGGAAQPAAAPAGPVQSAPATPMQQPTPQQMPPQSAAQPAPSGAPVTQAPMPAPAPAAVPMATSLPPPPAPSQQALVLPPTTRPAVGSLTPARASAAPPTPTYYGNALQVAVVQFSRASSGLSADDVAVLRDVAEIQKKQGGTVRIVGHASQDASGNDAQRLQQGNYDVSLARANAIAAHLVRLGVPRGSIVAEAAGDQQPEYDPVTAVAVASNRRAEIYLAF